MLNIREPMI